MTTTLRPDATGQRLGLWLAAPVPAGLVLLVVTGAGVSAHDAWMFLYVYAFVLVLGIGCAVPYWSGGYRARS